MDAPVHLMPDEYAQVLILVSPLLAEISPGPMTPCNGHVLKETVAALVTDRAIMRVVHHEPFDHMFSEVHGFFIGR